MQSFLSLNIMIIKATTMKMKFLIYLMANILMSSEVYANELCYWTVTGDMMSLPIDGKMITIPHDAVAVDLRNIRDSDKLFMLNTDEAIANCLYYIDEEDVVEGLPSTNVVRNGIAEELFLNDDEDFFCPIPFTAEFALLRITIRRDVPDSPTLSLPYYDTLLLPFEMDDVIAKDVNGIMPEGWFKAGEYVGDEEDCLYFEETDPTALKANVPYIVSYQYGTNGSYILFYGENKYVDTTRLVKNEGNKYSFCGTTVSLTHSSTYFRFHRSYNPYFALVKADTKMEPFRCFVEWAEETAGYVIDNEALGLASGEIRLNYMFEDSEETPSITGLAEPKDAGENANPTIYALSGQPLQKWQRGINIIKGKKIYIK